MVLSSVNRIVWYKIESGTKGEFKFAPWIRGKENVIEMNSRLYYDYIERNSFV